MARLHSLPTRETMLRLFPSEVNDSSKLYTKPVLFPTIRKWIEKLPTGYNNDKQKFERYQLFFYHYNYLLIVITMDYDFIICATWASFI